MDFVTTNPGPVKATINGVEYEIPRLLLPAMTEWMQELTDKQIERATKHLDDDRRAHFLQYYAAPMFDVSDIAADVRTPSGVIRLLKRQLPKATPPVPDDLVDALVQNGDPDRLRKLAEDIASVKTAVAIIKAKTGGEGDASDPLAKQQPGLEDSPSTGSNPELKLPPSTQASGKKQRP